MHVTIIATKSNTLVSWFIRLITNSPYSHLGIKASPYYMIDSTWGGVKKRLLPKKYDEFEINIPIENFKRGNDWLEKQMGKSYDFPNTLSTAIYNSLGWKRKKNLYHDIDKYTCSELVFKYFEMLKTPLRTDVDSANFHPGHIIGSIAKKVTK